MDHLLKVEPSLRTISMDGRVNPAGADRLREWLDIEILQNKNFGLEDGRFVGALKPRGARDTFAFLVDRSGREFFLAAANTSPDVWEWINSNGPVEFSVRTKSDGRQEAFNVTALDR